MAKIEDAIVDGVVNDLDAGEVPAAQPGMSTLHGGPGTTQGTHYSPGTSTSGGGVVGQHEGAETRPLAGDYNAPTGGDEGADTEQARADAYAATVAQLRIDRAIADQSFRQFRRDPVQGTGYVPGLEHLERRTRK